MKIGILADDYPNKRNINHLTANDYVRINRLNTTKYRSKIFGNSAFRYCDDYHGVFFGSLFYDVAHFFNIISTSRMPWITTFETTAPFYEEEISQYLHSGFDIQSVKNRKRLDAGIKACASDSCKALIAISQCTRDIQLKLISNFPEEEEAINSKLRVLYPPQQLLTTSLSNKPDLNSEKLTFMFVGRHFYRKGGLAILRSFEKLSYKYEFNLILISDLGNDLPTIFSKQEEDEARQLIGKYNGTWLKWYDSLPNEQVLALMRQSHIGLLPTYSDTFGYSVLEFQAAGCPVISSDVRALPEINNNELGWILPVGDKTLHREIANLNTILSERVMEYELTDILKSIFENTEQIVIKGERSIRHVADSYSITDYQQELSKLYNA